MNFWTFDFYSLFTIDICYLNITGITSSTVKFDESVTQEELLKAIKDQNNDTAVDGVLVQLPVPAHIRYDYLLCSL